MMTAEDRYHNDPIFHTLVDQIYAAILQKHYTPTEVRDAAMLASLKYEYTHARALWPEVIGGRMMKAPELKVPE